MNVEIRSLEKHEDERGILLEILKGDEINESIQQIYFSTSEPGAVRGGHYHNNKVEWFCVVKGTAKLFLEDITSKERTDLTLSSEYPTIVKIPPKIRHGLENVGRSKMYLIVVSNMVFEPNDPDTYTK